MNAVFHLNSQQNVKLFVCVRVSIFTTIQCYYGSVLCTIIMLHPIMTEERNSTKNDITSPFTTLIVGGVKKVLMGDKLLQMIF